MASEGAPSHWLLNWNGNGVICRLTVPELTRQFFVGDLNARHLTKSAVAHI